MAGRPGRSGGHNKLSLEAHLLRGTFNPTRHARHARLASGGPVWAPAPPELAGLGTAGRGFVARIQAVYDLSPLEGELALEGAMAADRLAELRARRGDSAAKERVALDKLELAWSRALLTCVLALRARL